MPGNCPATSAGELQGSTLFAVNTVAAASRFLASHPDSSESGWDTLVFFTTFPTTRSSGASYLPLANDVRGIARSYFESETFNLNEERGSGSAGFLRGTVLMSDWHSCVGPRLFGVTCTPSALLALDQNSLIGTLLHELGHRWGAYLHFEEGGSSSDALLGRSRAHWSYYADTGGSPLEGNHWISQDQGRFRLQPVPVTKYSLLDQYLMGLRPPEEVPPTRIIREPSPSPCTDDKLDASLYSSCRTNASTSPGTGARLLEGREEFVSLEQIIAVEGERQPRFEDSARLIHVGWALLETPDAPAFDDEIETIDTLRRAFTRAFYEATDRRMRAITTLSRRDDLGLFDFTLDAEGWQAHGARLSHQEGVLGLKPTAKELLFEHSSLELDAEDNRHLQLRLRASGALDGVAYIDWSTNEGDGAIPISLHSDGHWRTLSIPVPWTGSVRRMALRVPTVSRSAESLIEIDWIESSSSPHPEECDACDDEQSDSQISGGCSCASSPAGFILLAALLVRRRRTH